MGWLVASIICFCLGHPFWGIFLFIVWLAHEDEKK
jgi:hypothetical protein